MENFDVTGFITEARNNKIPDQEIYSFLDAKGLVPQDMKVPKTGSAIPNESFLQKAENIVGSIFPGKKVGQAIGTAIATGITGAKYGKEAALDVASTTPKVSEVLGDVAQGALTIGGLKAPIPGGVLGRLGQSSTLGAGLAGTGAIAEGKNIEEVVKDTATGAATGLVLQGAFEALPALGSWLGKQGGKLREFNLRLSPTQKQQLNGRIQEVTDYLKVNKITGNPEAQYTQILNKTNNLENGVQKIIKDSGKQYTKKELIDSVNSLPDEYATAFDNPDVYNQLINKVETLTKYIQNKLPDVIPAEKVNQFKRSYFKNAFNSAGDSIANEANLAIGDSLYNKLLADISGLGAINKEYSTAITAKKVLGKALGRNELGAIGNLTALGAGGAIGSAIGGPVGAAIGASAGVPVAKKLAGTAARTKIAQGLEKIQEITKNSSGGSVTIPRVLLEGIFAGD